MNLQDLKKPFQPREHFFNYEKWAYIQEDAIAERLDSVCGIDGWKLETYEPQQVTAAHWVARCDLSIKIGSEWVSRTGIGENVVSVPKNRELTDERFALGLGENGAKGAATDAFRRAARLWGIGRYLLSLPKQGGKPTVTNESQLRSWLMSNFMSSESTASPTLPSEEAPDVNERKREIWDALVQRDDIRAVYTEDDLKLALKSYTGDILSDSLPTIIQELLGE